MWRAQGNAMRHFRQEIKDLAHNPEKWGPVPGQDYASAQGFLAFMG
jgi:hypothetical protein